MQAALLVIMTPTDVQSAWTLEVFGGLPWNMPTPLSIHQCGEERIYLTARYNTKPYERPPYYSLRIAKWTQNHGWELELIHHKLYLSNQPLEVQRFEISHGYNLITINRVLVYRNFIWRKGAGIVIAHPETVIRGKKLPWGKGLNGFYVSGPVLQVAIEKKLSVWDGLFVALEGKLTASYTVIPIRDGNAYVSNVAVHGLFYHFPCRSSRIMGGRICFSSVF